MTKIFKVPFATQGDRTSIPDEVQADGAVSYTQGYSYDYERDQQTDPAAKDIEREKMNGMFHDITEAIGELQSFGFPKWATEGTPYPIRAIVYHKNKTWQSTIENNNIEPVAGKAAWRELKADLSAGDINVYNKTESDQRFQPLGNYQAAGYSYSKAESDTNY
ncbi:phage tail protein, partial [Providencia rettgeri]